MASKSVLVDRGVCANCQGTGKSACNGCLLVLVSMLSLKTYAFILRLIRTAVTLSPKRVDYWERQVYAQVPAERLAMRRYREDGMLLPFGKCRDSYKIPNP
jgi:hypothetical protein